MILEVKGLDFAYNGRRVLEQVSLALEAGCIMAVVGVNGAGKTTLLKSLNRVLEPGPGVVFCDGRDVRDFSRSELARKMGYLPQQAAGGRLTVFESVLLGRRPYLAAGMSARDYQVVEAALARLGLAELAMRPVSQLSGGQFQKVLLARALAQEPRVLLLDEPTSSLDLKNQLEVMGLVRRVVDEQHLAAVVSIHDLNLALRFADTFVFLKDGRVLANLSRDGVDAEIIARAYGLEVALVRVNGATVVVPQ